MRDETLLRLFAEFPITAPARRLNGWLLNNCSTIMRGNRGPALALISGKGRDRCLVIEVRYHKNVGGWQVAIAFYRCTTRIGFDQWD